MYGMGRACGPSLVVAPADCAASGLDNRRGHVNRHAVAPHQPWSRCAGGPVHRLRPGRRFSGVRSLYWMGNRRRRLDTVVHRLYCRGRANRSARRAHLNTWVFAQDLLDACWFGEAGQRRHVAHAGGHDHTWCVQRTALWHAAASRRHLHDHRDVDPQMLVMLVEGADAQLCNSMDLAILRPDPW
jgi:hypothetical protein